jgi:hypothetical protein
LCDCDCRCMAGAGRSRTKCVDHRRLFGIGCLPAADFASGQAHGTNVVLSLAIALRVHGTRTVHDANMVQLFQTSPVAAGCGTRARAATAGPAVRRRTCWQVINCALCTTTSTPHNVHTEALPNHRVPWRSPRTHCKQSKCTQRLPTSSVATPEPTTTPSKWPPCVIS